MEQKIEQIVLRSFRLRIPIGKACKRARVSPSTWSRWVSGESQPSEKKVDAILNALDQLEAEASAAA